MLKKLFCTRLLLIRGLVVQVKLVEILNGVGPMTD